MKRRCLILLAFTVGVFLPTGSAWGQTLLTTQTPALTNVRDGVGVNYELGMSFTSVAAGQITAVRFWKASSETGTHTGRIWSSTGQLLASVTFTNETASGWQQRSLAAPLSITANTTYLVSVNTGNAYYVATNNGLASQVVNGPLRSVVGNNGRYGSTGQFPTNTWQSLNYFRDIVFVSGSTTYSILGTISPLSVSGGVTVTVTGGSSATTNSSGSYIVNGLSNGTYTVTPAKTGATFNPPSRNVTIGGANALGTDFTVQTYSISGTITGGGGSTVALSGTASATVTADALGNYIFSGLLNGAYTIVPTKSGLTFNPSSQPVTVSGADMTGVNFAALYSMTGTITSGGNATVTLSGSANTSITANSSGNYTFSGLSNGNYTVTPTKAGFTFIPLSRDVTITGGSVAGINFVPATYSISGAITGGGGSTVALSGGGSATATADALGNYIFSGLLNGAYTIVPTKSGLTFNPSSQPVTVSGADMTGVNFAALYSMTGTITSGGNATVTLSGNANTSITANSSGNYTFSGLSNGNYTVTPTKAGFTFIPLSRDVIITDGSVAGINFVPATYSISGAITGGGGSTVALSGAASATVAADVSGVYIFPGLLSGAYTITPSKAGFTISPLNRAVTVSGADMTGIDFTATVNPAGQTLFTTQTPASTNVRDGAGVNYELGMSFTSVAAGQITAVRFWKASSETGTHIGRIWSGAGQQLASVTFANETASGWQQQALAAPLSIAANTTYLVSVNTGNAYYVATNNGLTSQVVNGNLRSVVGTNGRYGSTGQFPTTTYQSSNYFRDIVFVSSATGTTYNISGTISPTTGGAGATVAMTGSATASTTTNGSGVYAFNGLVNGSYTVTPSNSGYTFSPGNRVISINGASVTTADFTAVPQGQTFSISGTVGSSGNGALMTLSGYASTTVTANGSGDYTFSGLASGGYTVTPSKNGYNFSPTAQPVMINGANVADVNFTASAASVAVSISPTSALLVTGGSQQFSKTVTGTTNTAVTWSATGGTASSSGLYTAPGTVGTYTVTATSVADNTKSASATVTVTTPSSSTVLLGDPNVESLADSSLPQGQAEAFQVTANASGNMQSLVVFLDSTSTVSQLAAGLYADNGGHPGTMLIQGSSAQLVPGAWNPIVLPSTGVVAGTSYWIAILGTTNGTLAFRRGNGASCVSETSAQNSLTSLPSTWATGTASSNCPVSAFGDSSKVIFFDTFPGTTLSSNWRVISRHGEYRQSETECNIPQQVSVNNGLAITTAVSPGGQTGTCGDFHPDGTVWHAPAAWPYVTGDIQWASLNFTYGTVEIRAKTPAAAARLWPATWLLNTGCQSTNPLTGETGVGTCPDLGASGYTEIDMTECYGGGGCQFHVADPGFGIGNGCDAYNYNEDTNFHTFKTLWDSSRIRQYRDDVLITTCNHSLSKPMFLIVQTQTGGVGGTPNNALLPATFVLDYVKVTQP